MGQGAAAGQFAVKSCGKAHAWCRVCMPEQLAKLRKPKPPPKPGTPPCRKCGSCDACLGITAPPGMKSCRKCGETKPLNQFPPRGPGGIRGRRNQCNRCHNGPLRSVPCQECGQRFTCHGDRVLCPRCRPTLVKTCPVCSATFKGSMDQRKYCSIQCKTAATKLAGAAAHRQRRFAALQAYSGDTPCCSCCGETAMAFLALDHINGGGYQDRRDSGGFWSRLKSEGYPPGFQVLCHNCNYGRYLNGGTCPHKEA